METRIVLFEKTYICSFQRLSITQCKNMVNAGLYALYNSLDDDQTCKINYYFISKQSFKELSMLQPFEGHIDIFLYFTRVNSFKTKMCFKINNEDLLTILREEAKH